MRPLLIGFQITFVTILTHFQHDFFSVRIAVVNTYRAPCELHIPFPLQARSYLYLPSVFFGPIPLVPVQQLHPSLERARQTFSHQCLQFASNASVDINATEIKISMGKYPSIL